MNQITNSTTHQIKDKQSEFSPNFIRWLVGLTIATLLFTLTSKVMHLDSRSFQSKYKMAGSVVFPWTAAGGSTIDLGINEFQSNPRMTIDSTYYIKTFAGMVLLLVLGPTLLLFSWRAIKTKEQSQKGKLPLQASSIGFFFGILITFFIIVPAIPMAVMQKNVFQNLQDVNTEEAHKDEIVKQLNVIGYDAYGYYILPKSLGGGGWSYQGYSIPSKMQENEHGTYQTSDTVHSPIRLRIEASSKIYPNQNQMSMHVDSGGVFLLGR